MKAVKMYYVINLLYPRYYVYRKASITISVLLILHKNIIESLRF